MEEDDIIDEREERKTSQPQKMFSTSVPTGGFLASRPRPNFGRHQRQRVKFQKSGFQKTSPKKPGLPLAPKKKPTRPTTRARKLKPRKKLVKPPPTLENKPSNPTIDKIKHSQKNLLPPRVPENNNQVKPEIKKKPELQPREKIEQKAVIPEKKTEEQEINQQKKEIKEEEKTEERQSVMMKKGINLWGNNTKKDLKLTKKPVESTPNKVNKEEKKEKKKKFPLFQKRNLEISFQEEIKEAFFVFDFNGDGFIAKEILYDFLSSVEHSNKNEIKKLIDDAENIDFNFFNNLMNNYFAIENSSQELQKLMNELGPTNGEFDMDDFRNALLQVSKSENIGLVEEELDEILYNMQKNNRINVKQFCDMIGATK